MKETERMSRILRQMLGFYRPAADLVPTDLNALVEEAESLVTKRLRERNVKVEKQLQPDLPRVMASADQIKQVILNLVLNAAEAMPKGGLVTVSTESHRDAASGFIRTDAVRIQVADTGPGIAEEYLPTSSSRSSPRRVRRAPASAFGSVSGSRRVTAAGSRCATARVAVRSSA